MPRTIGREEIHRLISVDDAVVAEVLPREEYEWARIEGAVHLPLQDLTAELAGEVLDRDRPIIVYCNDYQ